MDNQTLNNKQNVLDFMDAASKQRELDSAITAHNSLPEVKLRKLQAVKGDAVNTCLNNVLGTLYKKSLPMNDLLNSQTCVNGCIRRYVNPSELPGQFEDFISKRCGGNNTLFYIHEALKRNPNNLGVKSLLEGVEKIVNETYEMKELNPDSITEDDYEFKITPETQGKIDDLIQSLELDDLSEVIKSNVKTSTVNEINAAKKEKEDRMKLEEELSLNNDMSTESAIDKFLEIKNFNRDPLYQPSLFEGVMISKYNTMKESTNDDLYVEDVSVFTEGVVKLIKDFFKAKNEANVQKMLAANIDPMRNSFIKNYKAVYAMYRSAVDSISHDKIIDIYKKAQTSRRISPDIKVSLLDLDLLFDNLEDVSNKNKAILKDLKSGNPVANYPVTNRKMGLSDVIKNYNSCVSNLDKYYESGLDEKAYSEKYITLLKTAISRAQNTKEAQKAIECVGILSVTELNKLVYQIWFVNSVVSISKEISKIVSRDDFKESVFEESVKEFTMLNIVKALNLEDFSLESVRSLARDYAQMQ